LFSPNQKIAFISVFDKTGLEPVVKALVEEYDYTLLSTGGTRQFIEALGLPVMDTEAVTGFGELLGGRVKSLHPDIFADILAEGHTQTEREKTGVPFLMDVVIVNLYPFEAERDKPGSQDDPEHLLHYIDIGGSALIRAGAKNYPAVSVLCEPIQYKGFLKQLKLGQGQVSTPYRKQLALEAFRRSVQYDNAISTVLAMKLGDATPLPASNVATAEALPQTLQLGLHQLQPLRYGENPHQRAALYGTHPEAIDFTLLHGKELSYNNLLDVQSGWDLVCEFTDSPACVIIKHNNPCGVAISQQSLAHAYQVAFDADPLSAFGGVVACNQPITEAAAKAMVPVFLEVIIAPDFTPEALAVLQTKKNLRLVKRPLPEASSTASVSLQYRQLTETLYLVQDKSVGQLPADATGVTVATQAQASPAQLRDLRFAWTVAKHVKSNAMVLAKDGRTVGIGIGQTSRIGALEIALKQAADEATDSVLGSDGFLPQEDNIYAAAQNRIAAIIQPGGSIKDKDVIAVANQYNIPMLTTGRREFKH
jgi:phosphoribosylaminoimidazolecarboxamide formyltransferase / IMP cyclohydrolase